MAKMKDLDLDRLDESEQLQLERLLGKLVEGESGKTITITLTDQLAGEILSYKVPKARRDDPDVINVRISHVGVSESS